MNEINNGDIDYNYIDIVESIDCDKIDSLIILL